MTLPGWIGVSVREPRRRAKGTIREKRYNLAPPQACTTPIRQTACDSKLPPSQPRLDVSARRFDSWPPLTGGCVFDSSRASTLLCRDASLRNYSMRPTCLGLDCGLRHLDLSDTPRPRACPTTLRRVRHASAAGLARRVRLVRRLKACRTKIPEACAGYRCTHIGSQTGRFFLPTLSPRTIRKYLRLFGSMNSVIHDFTGLCANQNMPCVWRAKGSEIGDSGGGSLERGSGSVEAVARRQVTRPLPLGAPSSQPEPTGAL